ncbi:TPA: hypothetical protein N0F65_009761 [Lagenidium giganteum]|uniref:Protein kinase domain-containing protein n=1 Tax=Lagenidium giganteum TaxID=4803 RepID=A0AAV2YM12_9STRA|nr:TPA: hypothetical protein N0F65_009761 [Lagenidium giganteum]
MASQATNAAIAPPTHADARTNDTAPTDTRKDDDADLASPRTSFALLEAAPDARTSSVNQHSGVGIGLGAAAGAHAATFAGIMDLFPTNTSVYTSPDNPVQSLSNEGSILIAHSHGQTAGAPTTTSVSFLGGGNVSVSAQDSLGSSLDNGSTHMPHSSLLIDGAAVTMDATGGLRPSLGGIATSVQEEVVEDDEESTSETTKDWNGHRRWSPRRWLHSVWYRFQADWDSYFLLFTLVFTIVAIPICIAIAAAFNAGTHTSYHARCRLASRGSGGVRVSTASISSLFIPVGNHFVMLIVASWVGVLCSLSRKRVLRTGQAMMHLGGSNLASAFMLPCYEAIWYMIALLSALGIGLYCYSFYTGTAPTTELVNGTALAVEEDTKFPCEVNSLPFVWILQLLPMLMVQRSVSKEAVMRSIAYSGCVSGAMLVCFMCCYQEGAYVMDAIFIGVHVLLLAFYLWAKLVFHARSTFDFYFIMAFLSSVISLIVQIMAINDMAESYSTSIGRCIVGSFDSLIIVAILLSLRADTKYWLGIDDGTVRTRNPMRQYMRQLAERGMITNFSTQTSVYDVHHMIEEHRKNVVDFSMLKLDCIIAQGATSIVMRGTMRGNLDIALKIYTSVQVTDEEVHRFSRETALNVQLSHPNVVKFFGLCVLPPSISLVFEFCEYGGLDVALRNGSVWSLSTKLKAWLDACKAVAYLHSFSPPLLHRDIKTDNFLLGKDYILKLTDFGEANLLRPRSDGTMTIAGTVDFMAPEMIVGGKTARYGTKVDVYSLMITLWQIMVPDRNPWEGKTHLEVYNAVTNGERPPLLPSIPLGCQEILVAGWAPSAGDRVAVEDIIPQVHQLWLFSLHQTPLRRTK